MFFQEDNTFKEIRRRSVEQWLEEIENHDDLLVRGGVKVTREYILSLQKEIQILKEKNQLKDTFLRRLKSQK